MYLFKKLIFGLLYLIVISLTIYQLPPILDSAAAIFSFDSNTLVPLIVFCVLVFLSSILFVLFSTIAQDWKLALPLSFLGALIPLLLLPTPVSFVLVAGIFLVNTLTFALLDLKLKSYLTFQPTVLLIPSIKTLTTLILLVFAFGFYLNTNAKIQKDGFSLPDSLIDVALKIAVPSEQTFSVKGERYIAQAPQLTPEQIQLLRQNPELLKQYNIDPSMLDAIEKQQSQNPSADLPTANAKTGPSNDLVKKLVKDQFDLALKPYLNWVAPVLAIIFYFSLTFFISIISIFLAPLIWLIFYILEKSGFIKFDKEMREVKKMVI